MNTVDRKLRFVQEFLRINDEELLFKLEQLLGAARKKRVSQEIAPLTIDEFNRRIDQSEDDFKEGRFCGTNELLKSVESWK